jgi:hypothetical protein
LLKYAKLPCAFAGRDMHLRLYSCSPVFKWLVPMGDDRHQISFGNPE